MQLINKLEEMDACREAVAWCEAHGGTLPELWRDCGRGDWMLWLAARAKHDHKSIVRAACECARLALPHAQGQEAENAIATTERWLEDKATIEEIKQASSDAHYAARAAAYYAATYSARAAAAAADCAYADVATWAAAGSAAYYAAASAYYNTWAAAARTDTLRQCADIVRKHIPCPEL